MRTFALVFFYACLCVCAFTAALAWAVHVWARRVVDHHVERALQPDPRVNVTLATALWKQHEAEWEAELARPYDWQQEGL